MKSLFSLLATLGILFFFLSFSYSQDQDQLEKKLIIREGKQVRDNIVAIEAYRIGDVLEVKVEVRMYAQRPRIKNVLIVGPKIGRISYKRKEELPLRFEEEDPYPITKERGILSFRRRSKVKQPKGTMTKELFKIDVPWDKIVEGKRYQLWVDVESKTRGQRPLKFRFDLNNLLEVAK